MRKRQRKKNNTLRHVKREDMVEFIYDKEKELWLIKPYRKRRWK